MYLISGKFKFNSIESDLLNISYIIIVSICEENYQSIEFSRLISTRLIDIKKFNNIQNT